MAAMTPPGWSQAGRVWLAVLFRRGLVIRHLVSKAVALVLDPVGACAVLCWRIHEHNEGDTAYFTVGEGIVTNTASAWVIPLDLGEYEVVPTQAVSPLHL